jgi:thiol-disulfide isomerase/thioredoxin
MQRYRNIALAAAVAVVAPGASASVFAQSIDGRWDAVITYNKVELPFLIAFSGEGDTFSGSFLNGDVKVKSTGGTYKDGKFVLNFDHYLGKLEGTVKDGKIKGEFASSRGGEGPGGEQPFHAERHSDVKVAVKDVPSIDGLWEIPVESPKGEKSWRFIVKQDGAEVRGSILRVDGDTGTLRGTYKDGMFVLAHFSGTRPLRLEVTPDKDGNLSLVQFGRPGIAKTLTAYRPEVARQKGLPEPSDFAKHTTIKDADQPFNFSFPDVNGKTFSSTDAKFKGKVVVAVVTGTWCPNCHDEAQFLVELDRKYHDRGLEIVALDFEEIEEQESGYKRLKAFVKQYGVNYTYLVAGAPIEMWVKVPQADNLNSWPTTFFVGRDGKVKKVHSGFASPASGEFHTQARESFTKTIEALLTENATASR